jgi:hypothetical protein
MLAKIREIITKSEKNRYGWLFMDKNEVTMCFKCVLFDFTDLTDRSVFCQLYSIFSKGTYLHVVQTGSQVNITPIQWVPGVLPPGVKRPGSEADHSPPASAEVKKIWIYTSTPP